MSTELARPDELVLLGDETVDRLAEVCLELAAELWVTRQRLEVLERTLVEADVTPSLDDVDLVDHRATRAATRDAYVARVLGPLLDRRDPHG